MGGLISSLHRLRRSFSIEIYLGKCDCKSSVHTLFDGLGHEQDGTEILTRDDLLSVFGDKHMGLIQDLTSRFENGHIAKALVISFLETGSLPKEVPGCFQDEHIEYDENDGSKKVQPSSTCIPKNRRENRILRVMCANVEEKPVAADPPSNKVYRQSLWKKHETVIQERIVRHVTIEDGVRRELVESDKSQNEVIHIECRETGEFAHREYSQQEQTEELDDEIATFIRATEEYVHLKSKDDEYEYMHSDIPTPKDDDTCGDPEKSIDESTEEDDYNY